MESQNTDWKAKWDDSYLAWICAFANAQGGVLEIGRGDNGEIVDLPNAKKLMDDLPNKIRSTIP